MEKLVEYPEKLMEISFDNLAEAMNSVTKKVISIQVLL